MTSPIKMKLLAASLLVLLLAAFAQQSGASAALVARIALGLAALAGLALWWLRTRGHGGAGRPFQLPPRLNVAARTGLSPRCGVALVEADGCRFLVAYGDGFAQLLNALPSRSPAHARAGRRVRVARKGGRS